MANRRILVDSNIILDIVLEDKNWFKWSSETLLDLSNDASFIINPIIYAEVSFGFEKIEVLEFCLSVNKFNISR